jgi:hypothetical protein
MSVMNQIGKGLLSTSILFFAVSLSSWAMDSTNRPFGKQVSATAHSYVLATGAGPFVLGENQQIGSTDKQCQTGALPRVIATLGDTGQSQNNSSCPLASFHVVNPYVTNNNTGGYDIYAGSINVSSSDVCHDRDGAALNWTVFCMKDV